MNKPMALHAIIDYQDINLLFNIDESVTFHKIQHAATILPYYPKYCENLIDIDSEPTVVIDLNKFLDISLKNLEDTSLILMKITNEHGSFALVVPAPLIQDLNLSDKIVSTVSSDVTLPIPVYDYVLFENVVYTKFNLITLIKFISTEIQDSLLKAWNYNYKHWDEQVTDVQLQPRTRTEITIRKTEQQTSYQHTNNYVISKVLSANFAFDENDVHEVISNTFPITPIPNSKEWIIGLIDYQQEGLPLIDLNIWLNIENKEPEYEQIVILNISGSKAGVLVQTTMVVNEHEINSKIHSNSIKNRLSLFLNIYQIYNEIVYLLNIEKIKMAIAGELSSEDWSQWSDLLTREIFEPRVTIEDDYVEEYALLTVVDNHNFFIHQNSIEYIRLTNNYEEKIIGGTTFTSYKGKWIPKFSLKNGLNSNSEGKFELSVILKVGSNLSELLIENGRLVDYDIEIFSIENWRKLSGAANPLGLKTIAITDRNVIGYWIDANKLNRSLLDIDAYWESSEKFLRDIPAPKSKELGSEEVIYGTLSAIWDENSLIYLFIDDKLDERKYAILVESIDSISHQPEGKVEIIPWKSKSKEVVYFYLTVNGKENTLIYEIPSECYLQAVNSDLVISTEEDEQIINFDNELIYVVNTEINRS